jgi:hypothetical protein
MTPLERQAARLGIRPPTAATLRRYGLQVETWLALLAGQGWKCAVCARRVPRWATDHEHVPLWKKLPPTERARFVRGVLCVRCNWRLVDSRMPAETAEKIAEYLRAYEARRDAA